MTNATASKEPGGFFAFINSVMLAFLGMDGENVNLNDRNEDIIIRDTQIKETNTILEKGNKTYDYVDEIMKEKSMFKILQL